MDLLSFFKGQSLSPAPSDDFWYGAAGTQTAAGVSVDEAKAMTYSACWAATMLLSTSMGMLPLKLFRKLSAGGSEAAIDHPAYRLIHSRPNPEMGSMMFRSSRGQQQINRGNCFAEIERNGGGVPQNLWPVHASRIPTRNIVREGGRIVYLINNDDGSKTPIRAENMLHVPSPISEDGIVGLGIVTQARLSIGLGIATETQGASYFGSGANPKLVIKGVNKFKNKEDMQSFRNQWNEMHGGPENANKPAILPEGLDITPLNFSAEDSQFLETRQFSIEEVARWYGVPPHLIGHLLRATYSNIEHLSLEFVKYSLMRWLVLWEQEINRKLLTEEEQKTMYARHVVDALERGDLASRTAAFKEEVFNGKKTINEWRAMDEENPIGPLGDVHWVQSAMVPLEIAVEGPQQPEPPKAEEPEEEEPEPMAAVTPEQLAAAMQGLHETLASEKADRQLELESERRGNQAAIESLGEQILVSVGAMISGAIDPVARQLSSVAEMQSLQSVEIANISTEVIAHRKGIEKLSDSQVITTRAMLRGTMARLLSIEIQKVKHMAEKPDGFVKRVQDFYSKHGAVLERGLLEDVGAVLSAVGSERVPAEVAREIAKEHIGESLYRLASVSASETSDLAKSVEECVSKWHEERAMVTL